VRGYGSGVLVREPSGKCGDGGKGRLADDLRLRCR
jgi:hypothetical protein